MDADGTSIPDRAAGRRLTGQMFMAVIFGLAIWNLIVSFITDVITPWLGTLLGQNPALPASFTKNYDYADLFVSIVEFCIAGIVAISINWFLTRPRRPAAAAINRRRQAVSAPIAATPTTGTRTSYWQPAASQTGGPAKPAQPAAVSRVTAPGTPGVKFVSPPAATATPVSTAPARPSQPLATPASPAARTVATPAASVTPAAAPTPAKAEQKPKKEKQVYYNIVGEPVSFDED